MLIIYIIVNYLHNLRQGQHSLFLVNKAEYQNKNFNFPEDTYEVTKKLVLKSTSNNLF